MKMSTIRLYPIAGFQPEEAPLIFAVRWNWDGDHREINIQIDPNDTAVDVAVKLKALGEAVLKNFGEPTPVSKGPA